MIELMSHEDYHLRLAVVELTHAIRELAMRTNLQEQLRTIMSQISDYLAKQTAHNTRVSAAIDNLVLSTNTIVSAQQGIAGDVQGMLAKIEQLQSSPGTFTPEDQATADALELQANALAEKQEALSSALSQVASALQQMDDQIPPNPPTPTPPSGE